MPCLAECGGFMYLHDQMEGMDGKFYQMTGVIPGKVWRTPKAYKIWLYYFNSK